MGRPTNVEIEARKAAQTDSTGIMDAVQPETPAQPVDGNTLLAQVLNRLVDAQEANRGISKDDLAEVLEAGSEGMRRALKPENARHPDVSAFNPEGERDHPRPALRRKTFMSPGMELVANELTVKEIEILNAIEHPLEARNGSWRAELKRTATDGTQELHIVVPCNTMDERMDLPKSLELILMELVGGTKAVDPETLAQRVAELEKRLAATA